MKKLKGQSSNTETIHVLTSLPKRKRERPRVEYSMSELFEENDLLSSEQVELAQLWKELDDCLEFLKVRDASTAIVTTNGKGFLYKQDFCCWDENDKVRYEGLGLRCRQCGRVVQESRDNGAPLS